MSKQVFFYFSIVIMPFICGCGSLNIAFDKQRIEDIHQIAGWIETFHQKTGYYPLTSGKHQLPLEVVIAKMEKEWEPPCVKMGYLELELQKVLGRDIKLPTDPGECYAGGISRFYQYNSDGQEYYVSAHLGSRNRFTRRLDARNHKYQIGSITILKQRIFRLRDIKYVREHGMDNPKLQGMLLTAVDAGDIAGAEKALSRGANISPICGFHTIGQPLVLAAQAGDLKMMRFLIRKGADLNGRNAYYDTPLMYALMAEKLPAAELLIRAGADVNQPNAFGVSAFMAVCGGVKLDLVKLFLAHGAQVNAQYLSKVSGGSPGLGKKQFTALMLAAKEGKLDVVKLLLEHGANPRMKDSVGKTARDYAIRGPHQEVAVLLAKEQEKGQPTRTKTR